MLRPRENKFTILLRTITIYNQFYFRPLQLQRFVLTMLPKPVQNFNNINSIFTVQWKTKPTYYHIAVETKPNRDVAQKMKLD